MSNTAFITQSDLGIDFDQGTQTPGFLNIVEATTTVQGKVRFANSDEASLGTAGVAIDAATLLSQIVGLSTTQVTDAFGSPLGFITQTQNTTFEAVQDAFGNAIGHLNTGETPSATVQLLDPLNNLIGFVSPTSVGSAVLQLDDFFGAATVGFFFQ
jgi:hypothetical protein